MPVVNLDLGRLSRLVGASKKRLMDRLPYIGLDIESVEGDQVRVEYSPNRPDFGCETGIAKALRGIMGIETGLPAYRLKKARFSVEVDRALRVVRPFIACVAAEGLRMDEEGVRQLISLQEDLHNGIGRRRRKFAIGLHDLDAVTPPFRYSASPRTSAFVPLGGRRRMTLQEILESEPTGSEYMTLLPKSGRLPLFVDSKGVVLSFPPIVNGTATAVTAGTSRVLVDVTSVDRRAGDQALAILATTLADMGGRLSSVRITGASSRVTPDLKPGRVPFDLRVIDRVCGLGLSRGEAVRCLEKSRMGVAGSDVLVPPYRVDMLHPVDVAEEVALGYGIDRIEPEYPPSKRPGRFNRFDQFLDRVADIMAGSEMIELMTFELTDGRLLYANFDRPAEGKVAVERPRSLEHWLLRDALLPTMMGAMSSNVKEEYPQRTFEIGRVYLRSGTGVDERWHLGALCAHSHTSFTEAKMYLEAFCASFGAEVETKPSAHWAFAEGRSASVHIGAKAVGWVGEVKPEAVSAFGVGVPVSGFEVDLRPVFGASSRAGDHPAS